MRQISDIHNERELAISAKDFLREDPDLSWRITMAESGQSTADALIRLEVAGETYPFLAEFKLKPSFDLIQTLAHRAKPANHTWLLITPRLTDRFVALCREANVACLDLNGRAWIRRDPLYIDRAARDDHARIIAVPPPPDLFAPKSSRLVRALLSSRHAWTQGDLSAQTELSRPLLSRLLATATEQGFVQRLGNRRGGSWSLTQPDALLDAWARHDAWSRRVTVHEYAMLLPKEKAAYELTAAFGPARLAFTQWFAAELRHPYTDYGVISAYVKELPSDDILKTLSARTVPTGGRLLLIRPNDEGVFQFTQTVQGLTLASDAQIYLDLLQVGQRGPDAAHALRNWEGFRQ